MAMNDQMLSKEERILRVRQAREAKYQTKMNLVAYNKHQRALRSDEAQLLKLDHFLGKNQGAKKERAKLLARIEAKKQ